MDSVRNGLYIKGYILRGLLIENGVGGRNIVTTLLR